MLRLLTLSSLAKVFPEEFPPYRQISALSALKNEPVSFQVAYNMQGATRRYAKVSVSAAPELSVKLYLVENVPSNFPVYHDHDDDVLRTCACLIPDVLRPYEGSIDLLGGQWGSVWVEVCGERPAGDYRITVSFEDAAGSPLGSVSVNLHVVDASLPPDDLIYTSWFHTDCLSNYYNVPVFSEEYWRIAENFAKTAVMHGQTVLLTPLFTPPLDTAVGGERPTVQLVDVTLENGQYTFGFEKLARWIDMCKRVGIQYYELSHFFTQWGAAHAPKVMATVDGEYRRLFGWDTDALSDEYVGFLEALSAELIPFLKAQGIQDRCFVHVSDEPGISILEHYAKAAAVVKKCFPDFTMIDALSDYQFYESGAVPTPIPATDHIEPFIENNVPNLWTYYCCGQHKKVANRFMAFPSARNRIIGVQLYKFHIKGFLQWGYNFYNTQLSIKPIDPFRVTDAGNAFPSGDAFVVYPGENGEALASLRLKVFYEALCDRRALILLESLVGRDKVMELLEEGIAPITFKEYPRGEDWLLSKRAQINAAIEEAVSAK